MYVEAARKSGARLAATVAVSIDNSRLREGSFAAG
jgi:hypothetical protein